MQILGFLTTANTEHKLYTTGVKFQGSQTRASLKQGQTLTAQLPNHGTESLSRIGEFTHKHTWGLREAKGLPTQRAWACILANELWGPSEFGEIFATV